MWLRKKGYIDESKRFEVPDIPDAQTAIDGCTQLALALGTFAKVKPKASAAFGSNADDEFSQTRRQSKYAANIDGFDVHAGTHVGASNELGRGKLVRYCCRPPVERARDPSDDEAA